MTTIAGPPQRDEEELSSGEEDELEEEDEELKGEEEELEGEEELEEEDKLEEEDEEEEEDKLEEEDEQEDGKAGGHDAASDSDDSLVDFSSPPKRPMGSQGQGREAGDRREVGDGREVRREVGDLSPKRLLEEEGESPLYSPPAKVQYAGCSGGASLFVIHSGFNVKDFRNWTLFFLSDFKSAPLFFGKSCNKNQNCFETSMDGSLK